MYDPLGGFDRIRDFYQSYLDTAYRISDENLSNERRDLLAQSGNLFAEPFIEPILRYQPKIVNEQILNFEHFISIDPQGPLADFTKTAQTAFVELVLSGLFNGEISEGTLKRQIKYPPYKHQVEMLTRGVKPGMPGIVTSGTGSGKTESFMLPLLAMLMKEAINWEKPSKKYLKRRWWWDEADKAHSSIDMLKSEMPTAAKPNQTPFKLHRDGEMRSRAMRGLLLFPMNALVEDQMTRLRKALDSDLAHDVLDRHCNGNRIYFGRYTSASPVTGFSIHPQNSCQKGYRTKLKRNIGKLFENMTAAEQAQKEACEFDRQSLGKSEETRYLFPRTDGAELISRWDMQATPPDLLITNTAMLGVMLGREEEAPIFEQTRRWLEDDDDAYFFLVLDELHLIRGSSGTEVAMLLRILLHRLGLDQSHLRHKLRILASSASLPVEGSEREGSLDYLWNMFGTLGTNKGDCSKPYTRDHWAQSIVTGETAISTLPIKTFPIAPFIALTNVFENSSITNISQWLEEHQDVISVVLNALNVEVYDGNIQQACIVAAEITARYVVSCCIDDKGVCRAKSAEQLSTNLFGCQNQEQTLDGLLALRGLLGLRGLADLLNCSVTTDTPSFRVHLFFRNLEGLFAALIPKGEGLFEFGPLSVEQGGNIYKEDSDSEPLRIFQLLRCEACGELLIGGQRHQDRHSGALELLPTSADLESLPEHSSVANIEQLSNDQYALFWPTQTNPKECRKDPEWYLSYLDPHSGKVFNSHQLKELDPFCRKNLVTGWIYQRPNGKDKHNRYANSQATMAPYSCPRCGIDYKMRFSGMPLSPIRSFRTGFAKTSQLLATELFALLKITTKQPKLVSFSDSRQDAARAALDIESFHYIDLYRQLLLESITRQKIEQENLDVETAKIRRAEIIASGMIDELFKEVQELSLIVQKGNAINLSPDVIHLSDLLQDAGNLNDGIRGLMKEMVSTGTHPSDKAGVALLGDSKDPKYPWYQLFKEDTDQTHWNTSLKTEEKQELQLAQVSLIKELLPRVTEILFDKTYFALEETGLGYPCPVDVSDEREREQQSAMIRVFADAYRVSPDKFVHSRDLKPWSSAEVDIHKRHRVWKYANAIKKGHEIFILDKVLSVLREQGHVEGQIQVDKLGIRLSKSDDPFYRCQVCSRVHLHRGHEICTRCFERLPTKSSGKCKELWENNFLARKVKRADQERESAFRLRCEELTGQTDNGAERLRRFKGILIPTQSDHLGEGQEKLWRRANEIDLLSVTTTMEVGIDIGPLQAIYQANMPPQRFNYQQRVGRAGRRGQAFSLVLTMCRSRSHDLYYFLHPEKITGDQPPPPFLTTEHYRIQQRMLMKGWLTEVFAQVRHELGANFSGYGVNGANRVNDIHGDFGSSADFVDSKHIQVLVLKRLSDTLSLRDKLAELLVEGSKLTIDDLLKNRDPLSVLNILIQSVKKAGNNAKKGLAETLAEAGYLPLYGMPTRERLLYHGQVGTDKERFKWQTMSRDTDLSIFEFAPGNELIKDKQRHLCVGLTGNLPDKTEKNYPCKSLTPIGEWYSEKFKACQCQFCQAWFTVNAENSVRCPRCKCEMASINIYECVTPLAYRTDLVPRGVDEQADFKVRVQLTYVEPAAEVTDASGFNSDLVINLAPQCKVVRINPGVIEKTESGLSNLRGFKFTQVKDNFAFSHLKGDLRQKKAWKFVSVTNQIIDHDIALSNIRRYEPMGEAVDHDKYILASRKVTDCILLKPKYSVAGLRLNDLGREPHQTCVRSSAISAMSLIVDRASLHLDIAPEEFEIMDPHCLIENGIDVPVLQIADALANGGGFTDHLCSMHINSGKPLVEFLIHSMLNEHDAWPLVDFLKKSHQENCDQSCYSCMSRFGNRQYHGLLDWRLGLAYLRALVDSNYRCGLDGDWSQPELRDWHHWVSIYLKQLNISQPGLTFEYVNNIGTYKVNLESLPGKIFIITHPLWDTRKGTLAVELDSFVKTVSEEVIFVSSFDLARRSFRSFVMMSAD